MSPHKGVVNNPHGRPTLGDVPRVMLSARVAPETKATLDDEAEQQQTSLGQLLDAIAARVRANRKRRKKP